jgi:hypothetical protein
MLIERTIIVDGNTVTVTVNFDLHDWSGDRDDKYQGEIFFSVIGE